MKYSKSRLLFALIMLLLAGFTNAQKTSQLNKLAQQTLSENDFANAEFYFKKLVERDSLNIDYLHGYALCCFSNFKLSTAEIFFRRCLQKDINKKFADDIFLLAKTLKMQGKYKLALKEFEKFERRNHKKNSANKLDCKNEIEGCVLALKSVAMNYKIEFIDSTINTANAENAAFLYNNKLYFTTLHDSINYAIYYSKIKGNEFEKKIICNDLQFEKSSTSNFFIDGNNLYFTKCSNSNGTLNCSIYSAKIQDEKIIDINKLNIANDNASGNITQANIGILNSQKYLFFVSNADSEKSKKDIFWCKMLPDGSFEKPQRLGNSINTDGDEITPFFCNKCQTLFFSSNYHIGFGGYDVFKSKFINDKFIEPQNLGKPINSSLNDLYFTHYHDKNVAFVSSNRKGSMFAKSEFCCNDILKISFPEKLESDSIAPDSIKQLAIASVAKPTTINDYLPLQLYFDNDKPDSKTLSTTTFKTYLETVAEYQNKKQEYIKNYSKGLAAAEAEDATLMFNYFFDDSVSASIIRLKGVLNILENQLNAGKTIKLIIKGYCSPLASNEYNKNLASRRICSLVNYLNSFDGNKFHKFLKNNALIIEELEIGDADCSNFISDNIHDLKNSVYSLKAAMERKVAIVKVEIK